MPGVKKTWKKASHRKWRKGGKRRGYKTNNNLRSLNPIAQRYICKMKYAQAIPVTGGVGTYALQRMNLNSIFDPDQSGVGHQPYAHDTLSTLYNRYRVIACSYRISAVATGATGSYPITSGLPLQIAVLPSNEIFPAVSVSEVRENPRAKYALQNPGAALKVVSGRVYIPSLMGRTKAQYMADDRFQAVFGSSPADLAILSCYAGTLTETGGIPDITFNVELEYTVECFDIKNLAQS